MKRLPSLRRHYPVQVQRVLSQPRPDRLNRAVAPRELDADMNFQIGTAKIYGKEIKIGVTFLFRCSYHFRMGCNKLIQLLIISSLLLSFFPLSNYFI